MAELKAGAWDKLIRRWSPMGDSGEVRLVSALLSGAIADEVRASQEDGRPLFDQGFFTGGGFDAYCRAIGIDARFLREQVIRACAFDAEPA